MGTGYRAFLLPRQRAFRPDAARLLELIQRLERERWLPAATGAQFLFDEPYEEGEFPLLSANCYVDAEEAAVPNPVTQEWLGSLLESDSMLYWTIDDYDRTDLAYPFTKRPEALPFCELMFHLPVDYVFDSNKTAFQEEEPPSSWLSRLLRRRRPKQPKWGGTALCSCGADLTYQLPQWSYYTEGRLRTVCLKCGAPFDPSPLPAIVRDVARQERIVGGLTYRFAILLECEKSRPSKNQDYDFAVQPPLLSLAETVLDQEIVVVSGYY
jgi:hypothetical protein